MNKDEVIALAEKCKLAVLIHSQWTAEVKEFTVVDYVVEGDLASLMQFADLVASAERERTWVGLTDEEIKEIFGPWGDTPVKGYTRKLIDKIEAALKKKNT